LPDWTVLLSPQKPVMALARHPEDFDAPSFQLVSGLSFIPRLYDVNGLKLLQQ